MHAYLRHIGDYHKKAGRLSMLEHGAYTLLMDACYDRETFPTREEAIDWVWARSKEEIAAVEFILSKFFRLVDGVYVQCRIAEEIENYKIKGLVNKLTGYTREAKKRGGGDEFILACAALRDEIKADPKKKTHAAWLSVVENLVKQHETAPNHKPLTVNQEPLTINQEPIINKNISPNSFEHVEAQNEIEIERASGEPPPPQPSSVSHRKQIEEHCFEVFWKSGIRKDNKKKSRSAFARALKSQSDPESFTQMLCEDIAARLKVGQLGFDRMLPTTYLNGERWNDDVIHDQQLADHPEFEWFDFTIMYNQEFSDRLGPLTDLTHSRQRAIQQCISVDPGKRKKLTWWKNYFNAFSESRFAFRRDGNKPDFDYLIHPNTIARVKESLGVGR